MEPSQKSPAQASSPSSSTTPTRSPSPGTSRTLASQVPSTASMCTRRQTSPTGAGPHWNPLNLDHGAPEDEIRHVGGLGNITADADGHSKGSMTDHQVKLFEHEKYGSVVGRSMMIHAKEDDLGLGDNSKANEPGPPQDGFVSKITGNAGARIACGE